MGVAAERGRRRRRRLRMLHSISPRENQVSRARVGLDYATCPQIIHAIASFACPRTKLALRATSRALRWQLDPEIFKHLYLTGQAPQVFKSRTGPLPGQAWEGTPDADERDTWRRRLKYARVIDQTGSNDFAYLCGLDPSFAEAFREVHTIRWLGGHDGGNGGPHTINLVSAAAETVVSYIHLCEPLPGFRHHVYNVKFEPRPMRHVLTVYYDPNASTYPETRLDFHTKCLGDNVLFIFLPHHRSSSPVEGRSKALHLRTSLLGGFIQLITSTRSNSVTLVGIEGIPLRLLGLPESSSAKDVRKAVSAAIDTHVHNVNGDAAVTLHYQTLEKYRMSVGSSQYELETVHPQLRNDPPPRLVDLDASSFPHIMASIFRHAPRKSLLQLRSTSRALKEEADRFLFERVVVHHRSTPPQMLLHSPDCALPFDPWWDDTKYLYCDDETKERKAAPFANTRVLEMRWNMNGLVNHWTPRTAPFRGLLQACGNIEVVQHLNACPSIIPDVTNVIFYCINIPPEGIENVCPLAKLGHDRGDVASCLVVRLLYGPGDCPFDSDVIEDIPGPFTRPVVVVLSEWDAFLSQEAIYISPPRPADVLLVILRHFMRIATDLTVVGAEQYLKGSKCRCPDPDDPTASDNDICLCQGFDVWDIVSDAQPHPTASADRGWPTLLTHDEYAAKVGDAAQWHLEIPSLQTLAAGDWND